MKSSRLSTRALLVTLAIAATGVSPANFIFSGDFTKGEGQIELASDLNFNVVTNGFVGIVALDDIVTFDGSFNQQANALPISLLLNSNPISNGPLDFTDNLNQIVGDLDSSDGTFQLDFVDEFEVLIGDIVTLQAGTWSNLGGPDFNPDYNTIGTHNGKVLLTEFNGLTLAEIQGVPEPTTLGLLAISLLSLARRRR